MNRRDFLDAMLAVGASGVVSTASGGEVNTAAVDRCTGDGVPDLIGGMSLEALRADYRKRLFEQYLPFWDKGAFDAQRGGFICELNDDGSVASDEKVLTYQGRAIWVYAFLYNHFGKDPRWLKYAEKTRDFMVEHMYAQQGRWREKTRSDGTVIDGVGTNVFGWLFAAGGLAQLYVAAGNSKDLKLTKETIQAAVKTYDDPAYADTSIVPYTAVEVPIPGLRSQGHSMVLVWVLSQLLGAENDPKLAELQRGQVDIVMNRYWHPEYGIANEFLAHDYSRIPSGEAYMYAGHALETLWIVMHEALRIKDRALFDTTKIRIRRLIEMCWDYVFDGWASGDYSVVETAKCRRGPNVDLKTMWAQCEIMISCLTAMEYTGEVWTREWYDRARAFALKTMPVPGHAVWRQAVDRRGKDIKRVGYSTKRKDNFHQVRMLMLNLLSLERMVGNGGKLAPFPQ
jgi:N-acylglucosamine 2-epimerase